MAFFKSLLRPFKDWRIRRLPSRIFLETTLIPALAGAGHRRMLCVGTRSYNRGFYDRCTAAGIKVWSIDMDAAAAPYGAPNGHFVGNICAIDKLAGDQRFDVIILNGVLGWGLNTAPDALMALAAMKNVCTAEALLFVGWNPGRTDGVEVAAIRPHLKPAALGEAPANIEFPARGGAQRHPHRYELFTFL